MPEETIPFINVKSELGKIDLAPDLENLLKEFSEWFYIRDAEEDWIAEFIDDSSLSGSESSHNIYSFLTHYGIGIRPSGFEFYRFKLIEGDKVGIS